MVRFLFGVVVLMFSALSFGNDQAKITQATQFFNEYEQRGRDFSPKLTDLYSDRATIQNLRRYPGGKVRDTRVTGAEFKKLILMALPVAQARGDRNTYSAIQYKLEGNGVRISAVRFSHSKHYSSPINMLVMPNANGHWQILDEYTESQP